MRILKMSTLGNPLIGTTLGVIDLVAIGFVYGILSKRISKLENNSTDTNISSNTNDETPIRDNGDYLELLSKFEQIETERDIMVRKLTQHEIILGQILKEFKELKDKSKLKKSVRKPGRLALSTPIAEISEDDDEEDDDDDEEARKFLIDN